MPLDANSATKVPLVDLAEDIRKLFVGLHQNHKIPDVQVFREVYESERPIRLDTKIGRQAHDALGKFLRDVTTCPPEVLTYAKQLLFEREPPLASEVPNPDPVVVVAPPSATYRGRVPNHQPHPALFGPDAPEN